MNAIFNDVGAFICLLHAEAWLRHDLEHNPRNVASRLRVLEKEIESINETISPLVLLKELHEHAQDCVSEMNWFSQKIFNRSLVKEVNELKIPISSESEYGVSDGIIPSALIWKDENNETRSVIINAEFEVK